MSQQPSKAAPANNSEESNDEVTAKYKKLLSMARSSLESNQATIAAKDKQISQLMNALEEEKSRNKRNQLNPNRDDESAYMPRRLLRRVDIADKIWILIEYEGADDAWKEFSSEQDLDDFIQRISGVPLSKPQRSLTPGDSQQIEEESRRKIDRVVDEFRRFKLRTEIVRKQKDVDSKNKVSDGNVLMSSSSIPSDILSAEVINADEFQQYKLLLQNEQMKWRQAFERQVKENEILKTNSGEAFLIAQLRERYETCLREKNELIEKLRIYEKVLHDSPSGNKSLEQSYIDLREEYKEYRRRVQAIEMQRQLEDELRGSSQAPYLGKSSSANSITSSENEAPLENGTQVKPDITLHNTDKAIAQQNSYISSQNWSGGNPKGIMESKIQYVRQMILQYLSCKDSEVKLHIESALMTIFRFNDNERKSVEERKLEESADTLSSITNFLGGFATS